MYIETPTGFPGWRKGQTIFNFLEWLREAKGMSPNQSARMADPFHLSDEQFDALWKEYTEERDNKDANA